MLWKESRSSEKSRKTETFKEQVEALVENLLGVCEGVSDRPKTIKALELCHPEYKNKIDALTIHGKQCFGAVSTALQLGAIIVVSLAFANAWRLQSAYPFIKSRGRELA